MAIAGGMTTAYRCRIDTFELRRDPTTYPSRECATVDTAMEMLERGESVIVAANDMERLRQRLASFGIR